MIKKRVRRFSVFAVALAVIFSAVAFGGCGKTKIPNDETTIEIYTVNAGYGIEWLEKTKEAFEKKYPEYAGKVYIWSDEGGHDRSIELLTSGPKNTSADLLFTNQSFFSYHDMGSDGMKGYDNILANLTDIYEANVPGENITFAEKMDESYRKTMAIEEEIDGEWKDNYYMVPWVRGINGVIYNKTILDNYSDHAPRTTLEWFEVADDIKEHHSFPRREDSAFVSCISVSYWGNIVDNLWAQYETRDGYLDFWNGEIAGEYSEKIFDQKGRLYALDTLENILNPRYGRSHKNTSGLGYSEAQARIISGDGVFTVAGDWYENETRGIKQESGNDDEIYMMQLPIVSALSDKLSYWDIQGDYESAMNDPLWADTLKDYDRNLRALVKYVDEGGEKPTYGSTSNVNDDIEIVRRARKVYSSSGDKSQAVIPSYSNNVTGAKKFLQFLATDEACRIFVEYTGGAGNAFDYDVKSDAATYAKLTDFQKKKFDMMDGCELLPAWANMKLYWKASLRCWNPSNINSALISPETDANYKSAKQIFEGSKITRIEFDNMLRSAGLL